jgi:hypothetical protein
MAGLEYDEDFLCEEELVQELLKFNIYGEQTTLDDGIVEAAEKNLNETVACEYKTLFGQNEGKTYIKPETTLL